MFDHAHATALITGASSGLGETSGEPLAMPGANVVHVARTASELEALAAHLRATYKVEATVIAADLADLSAPARVQAETRAPRLSVNLLVNNAGFALAGAFLDHDFEREADQIAVNVSALTALLGGHSTGRHAENAMGEWLRNVDLSRMWPAMSSAR